MHCCAGERHLPVMNTSTARSNLYRYLAVLYRTDQSEGQYTLSHNKTPLPSPLYYIRHVSTEYSCDRPTIDPQTTKARTLPCELLGRTDLSYNADYSPALCVLKLLNLRPALLQSLISATLSRRGITEPHLRLTNVTRLDALVNNAGIVMSTGSVAEQTSQCFQTNANGPVLMGEGFAPLLKNPKGTPRLVNVSSAGASVAMRPGSHKLRLQAQSCAIPCKQVCLNMVSRISGG